MLGKCVRAKVVKPIGYTDESSFTYPLNYGLIYGTPQEEYTFILGIDHKVNNFDGRIVAFLESENKSKKRIWFLAPKSTRFINIDILDKIDIEKYFPEYKLVCLFENSCGAIVYRNINDSIRYLLIKNKRSANWGFPKGHMEKGETKFDTARREVLEETGLHIRIHMGFEAISKYKIKDKIDKRVSLFVASTEDTATVIQEEEIEDYIWLPYEKALPYLRFENDKTILKKSHSFLLNKNLIPKSKKTSD